MAPTHCYESIGSIRQGEDAEFVEYIRSVGDGRKQPIGVLFIDTLWEEGDNSKKLSERWRGEREFDRGREAPRVLCVKHSDSLSLPLPGQSVGVPFIVLSNSYEEGNREGMEVELLQESGCSPYL